MKWQHLIRSQYVCWSFPTYDWIIPSTWLKSACLVSRVWFYQCPCSYDKDQCRVMQIILKQVRTSLSPDGPVIIWHVLIFNFNVAFNKNKTFTCTFQVMYKTILNFKELRYHIIMKYLLYFKYEIFTLFLLKLF